MTDEQLKDLLLSIKGKSSLPFIAFKELLTYFPIIIEEVLSLRAEVRELKKGE